MLKEVEERVTAHVILVVGLSLAEGTEVSVKRRMMQNRSPYFRTLLGDIQDQHKARN